MTPEEEIIYLQGVKQYLDSRIQKLKTKIRNDKRPKVGMHRLSYSGLWVQADCLIVHVQKHWLDQDRKLRHLEEKSTLSEGTISKIMNGKTQWCREETAEAILIALGLPHVFNEIEKVRIKRKYVEIPEPPFSHYVEE